jgi:glycosyltransferase involved in cell wall biosynthesis
MRTQKRNDADVYSARDLNKGARKKVVWLPFSPNKNIYLPIYDELGRLDEGLDLVMIIPDLYTSYGKGTVHYEYRYLPYKEYKRLFFLDYLRKKSKNEEIDVTTTLRLKGLYSCLKKERPDLVITNMEYSLYSLEAAVYCRLNHVPYVLQSETKIINKPLRKLMYKLYMLLFFSIFSGVIRHITCWTEDSCSFMEKEFKGINRAPVSLLPPGVDLKKFYPAAGKRQPRYRYRILVVSRIVPYKRHEDIVKAAKVVRQRRPDLDFEISFMGNGPSKGRVESLIELMGLQGTIRFIPGVDFRKMREVYSEYDVLLLASYNEAIGTVVPEAMACGTAAIVSDTAGAKTYVRDGENGCIFRTFDVDDLAQKIILLSDKDKSRRFGRNAEQHIRANFNVNKISRKLHGIISSILD